MSAPATREQVDAILTEVAVITLQMDTVLARMAVLLQLLSDTQAVAINAEIAASRAADG